MNYIMIRTDDMLNGDGLRVVLFCTACKHHCKNCHNPETWKASNGCLFDNKSKENIFRELENDYISGLTLSGGDPLDENNLDDILNLCKEVKEKYPNKTIWLYSGFTWDECNAVAKGFELDPNGQCNIFNRNNKKRQEIIKLCDVFIDGIFIEELSDVNYHWAGSTNQRVIDIKESLKQNKVVLHCD